MPGAMAGSGPAAKPEAKAGAKAGAKPPLQKTIEKAAPKAKAAVKVKLTKPVVDRVKWLNDCGVLEQELRLGAVATRLAELSQADALDVLQAVLDDPSGREDPITWVREAAKALADASKEEQLDSGDGPAAGDVSGQPQPSEDALGGLLSGGIDDDDDREVRDELAVAEDAAKALDARPVLPEEVYWHAEEMRKKGVLRVQLEPAKMGALLAILGPLPAIEVLNDLEGSKTKGNEAQSKFLVDTIGKVMESMRGTQFAVRLSRRIRWMNENLGLPSPLHIGQAALALAGLGEAAALLVLKKIVRIISTGEELEKPTEWIVETARKVALGIASLQSADDVATS